MLTVLTAGMVLVLGGALLRVGRPQLSLWSWERWHEGLFTAPFPESWTPLAAIGTALGLVLPVLAIVIILLSIVLPGIRGAVGILWDIGTFWPRRYHPLAPPAYSERAVPEIADYVSTLAGERGVVLPAHSQGGVLLVSALLRVDGDRLERITAFTHGSPLAVYYRRFWPGTFGRGMYADLRAGLEKQNGATTEQGWWNAFRLTDPIAEEVFTGPDERQGIVTDVRIPDPRWIEGGPCPSAATHFGYLDDPEVAASVDGLGALVSR